MSVHGMHIENQPDLQGPDNQLQSIPGILYGCSNIEITKWLNWYIIIFNMPSMMPSTVNDETNNREQVRLQRTAETKLGDRSRVWEWYTKELHQCARLGYQMISWKKDHSPITDRNLFIISWFPPSKIPEASVVRTQTSWQMRDEENVLLFWFIWCKYSVTSPLSACEDAYVTDCGAQLYGGKTSSF